MRSKIFKGRVFIQISATFMILGLMAELAGCQMFFKTQTSRGVYHTMQSGQTLYSIAKVYDLDVKILQRVNEIRNPRKVQPGQRLWIPNALRVLMIPKISQGNRAPSYPKIGGKRVPQSKKLEKQVRPTKGLLSWPIRGGFLTSKFGRRWGRDHDGIDIASKIGTIVHAASDGKVVFSGKGPKGYGLMVIIKHSEVLITVYAHNSVNHVGRGMRVSKGQKIALVGSTGRSTGPHLHFEVRNNTQPVNPLQFLPPRTINQVASR